MIAGSLKGEMWLGHRLLGLGTQFDLVGSLVLFSGIVASVVAITGMPYFAPRAMSFWLTRDSP